MNSSFVRTMAFAALLGAPLAGFGQIMHTQAGGPRAESLTLLTGPHLTSAPIYSGVGVVSLSPKSEDIFRIDEEIRTTRERLEAATLKLRQLQDEREILLSKLTQAPEKGGTDLFNFKASPALWPRPTLTPQPFNGEIRFSGATAKPQ